MSLYRKYRPQNFSHLKGQDHINQTLNNALKLDRVNHAYLFTGPRGTGKTSTARLMAKAINCLELNGTDPCNSCEICTDINDGRLIDLIEIDAASNRGIDEIRDLREKINFAPTRAKSKVYIIDEVHMLTKEAFNALLKTLEEPPSHVYFILATTEVHKIPETILSRCQRFDFRRIDEGVIIDRLKEIAAKESIEVDDSALSIIAHHAEGGMRDAIGLMEQLSRDKKLEADYVCEVLGVSGIASIEKLYSFLKSGNIQEGLKEISKLYLDGSDLSFLNKRFLEFLRKEMIKSVNENRNQDTQWIIKVIGYFQEAYGQARFATIPQLPLEIAIIRSCEGIVATKVVTNTETKVEVAPNEELRAVPTEQPADREHKMVEQIPNEGIQNAEPVTESVPEVKQSVSDTESAEKKSLNGSSSGNKVGLAVESIKKQWDQLEKHLSNPIVKRGIKQCSPIKVDDGVVTLGFGNNFHMNKFMETANRTDAETAFSNVFGETIKLVGEVHKGNVVPVAASSAPFEETAVPETDEEEQALENKVLNIFEGEVV